MTVSSVNRPAIALVVATTRLSDEAPEVQAMIRQAAPYGVDVSTVIFPFEVRNEKVDALVVPPRFLLESSAMEFFPNLQYVGVPSVGKDHVHSLAAEAPHVQIINAPGFNTEEVAEHTVSFILMLLRGIPEAQAIVESGRWDSRATGAKRWGESVVGLVGYGAIARRVSEVCQTLGLRVIIWNRSAIPRDDLEEARVEQVDSLYDLLKAADVVSLHVPDTSETHHMINAEALTAMKPTASLINVGRGGLIVESALSAALNAGRIRSAALDVLEAEPPDTGNPLLGLTNAVITPHSAWYSAKSSVRAYEIVADRIAMLLSES